LPEVYRGAELDAVVKGERKGLSEVSGAAYGLDAADWKVLL